MFLRNYDNIVAVRSLPSNDNSLYLTPSSSSVFGENSLFNKNVKGAVQGTVKTGSIFTNFILCENNDLDESSSDGSACYLRWSDSIEEPTYDEHTVNLPSTSQAISISMTEPVYEDGDYKSTVTAIYRAKEALTVGSIVVLIATAGVSTHTYPKSNLGPVEVYRKVLDEPIEVPADANFVLTFTVTKSANPNKPADYAVSATTE